MGDVLMALTNKAYRMLIETQRKMEWIYGCAKRTGEQPERSEVPNRQQMKRWAIAIAKSAHKVYLCQRWYMPESPNQIERMQSTLRICRVGEGSITAWTIQGIRAAEEEHVLEKTVFLIGCLP